MPKLGESIVYASERSYTQGGTALVEADLNALISGYYGKLFIAGGVSTEFSLTGNIVQYSSLYGTVWPTLGQILFEEGDVNYQNILDSFPEGHYMAPNLPLLFFIPLYKGHNFVAEKGFPYPVKQDDEVSLLSTIFENGVMNQGVMKMVHQLEVLS